MSGRYIIDAGPALNFFSVSKERLLFEVLRPIHMPETVRDEVLRKANQDQRFAPSATVLRKLPERLLVLLCDDDAPPLSSTVARIAQMPMSERLRNGKDAGELMVVAHAVDAAELGADSLVIIDDEEGVRLAISEARRLDRLRAGGRQVGTLKILGTLTVLRAAAGSSHLPDRRAMQHLYQKLRERDNGLPPVESTDLLAPSTWQTP